MNLAKRGFLHLCQFWNPVVVLVKFVSCKKLVYSIHIFIQLHFHEKFMFIHSIPIRKIIENLVKTHKNSNVSSEIFQPYCVKKNNGLWWNNISVIFTMFNIWAPATLATFSSAPRNRLLVGGVGVGRSGGDIFWKVFEKGRLRSIDHAIKLWVLN